MHYLHIHKMLKYNAAQNENISHFLFCTYMNLEGCRYLDELNIHYQTENMLIFT